jgi:hypothetical protein
MFRPMSEYQLVEPEYEMEELARATEGLYRQFEGQRGDDGQKKVGTNPAILELINKTKAEIADFRPKLPLLIALKNDGLA